LKENFSTNKTLMFKKSNVVEEEQIFVKCDGNF